MPISKEKSEIGRYSLKKAHTKRLDQFDFYQNEHEQLIHIKNLKAKSKAFGNFLRISTSIGLKIITIEALEQFQGLYRKKLTKANHSLTDLSDECQ